ncbi:HAD family hydrolase [Chloroflexota bacterium]
MNNRKYDIELTDIEAFVFDMDGVITDTASTHAEAWKKLFDEYLKRVATRSHTEFTPFGIDHDYYVYINGKPRYDGVLSFLNSRGIKLPYGDPKDRIDLETACGLGNRKEKYYHQYLESKGVNSYLSSVQFIANLRSHGVCTAVISASRNAALVLKAANVLELFDVKVDGVDSVKLNLRGKPHPDIFLEAARRLGVLPEHSIIVEDALAGVEAGRRGNFKLVIGIDRTEHGELLKNHGADIVVPDLSQLNIIAARSHEDSEI